MDEVQVVIFWFFVFVGVVIVFIIKGLRADNAEEKRLATSPNYCLHCGCPMEKKSYSTNKEFDPITGKGFGDRVTYLQCSNKPYPNWGCYDQYNTQIEKGVPIEAECR